MAGKAYLTQAGVSVKIKKAYVVEDGKTVKLKKAYGVIDGKTVKLWSSGELVYYGTLADVAVYSESDQVGFSNDNYAMISGGRESDIPVYAYDKSLTLNKSATLSTPRNKMIGGTVGEYVVFGPGYYGSSGGGDAVDAFNNALTRTTITDNLPSGAFEYSGGKTTANVGDYMIFQNSYGMNKSVYNKSLTLSTITWTSGDAYAGSKGNIVGDVEDYAIFIGQNSTSQSYAMAVDKSLTKRSIDNLTTYKTQSAVANVGGKVLFAGGRSTGSGLLATVEAYDNSLTHTVLTSLSVARWYVAGATIEGYALFAGGYNNSGYTGNAVDIVDVYDESLTRTIATTPLSQARYRTVGMTIGNYIIFASGEYNNQDLGTVDVYEVS